MRARGPSKRACVAGALAVAFAGPGAGAARASPRGWEAAAAEIAAPWPGLQRRDGHFVDYIVRRAPGPKRDDYGDAMLGYGLLLTADRTGSARLRDAGLRAVAHAARGNGHVAVAPFRFLALASAYNLARTRFAGAPLLRSHRAALERALRRARATRVGRARVTNKSVVEAAAILELVRSGLRSHARGTVLNRPGHSAALARRFLARDLPRAARRFERSAGSAGRVAVLGDF